MLDGRGLTLQVGDRLTGAELQRNVDDGIPIVTLSLWDRDQAVLASGVLGQRVMTRKAAVTIDGLRYIATGVQRTGGGGLALPFESASVRRLKEHGTTRPLRASRDETTRLAFVAGMIRDAGVPVIALDETVGQRIAGTTKLTGAIARARRESSAPSKGRTASRGVTAPGLTIKGEPANSGQRREMAIIRAVGDELRSPPLGILAGFVGAIQESAATNLPGGDRDSEGTLQYRRRTAASLGISPRDSAAVARAFFKVGALGTGKGAIHYARANPTWSPGQIIAAMHNPGTPLDDYDQWREEADEWLLATGGTQSGGRVGATTQGSADVYERQRGESTWAAGKRLLDEVNCRMFDREGVIVLASEPALMRAPASIEIGPSSDFWDPDFDWHAALRVSELSGEISADRYQADPGEVADVDGLTQIDRKWLISRSTVDLLNRSAPVSIELRQPQALKAEPAADATSTAGSPTSTTPTAAATTLRDRIVATARASMTERTGHRYYSQPGELTDNPTAKAPARSDCSQWIRAIYLRAGAQDPGRNTWEQAARGKRTTSPKPGDLMMSATTGHVELYVGPGGATIGHGSPPIDAGNVSSWPGHYFVTFSWLD